MECLDKGSRATATRGVLRAPCLPSRRDAVPGPTRELGVGYRLCDTLDVGRRQGLKSAHKLPIMTATLSTPGAATADILRAIAEGTSAATGDEFFRSLAKHAALALGARYAFAAETVSEHESRSLAYWEGSDFGEGFSYRFPGTPCLRVSQGHVCATPTDVAGLYPEDLWLRQIAAEAYIGVPMRNAQGKVLGHIAVLHTGRLEPTPEVVAILQIFAARGCAELERMQSDRALTQAMQEVQRLRDRLEAENVYFQEEIQSEHNFEDLV